MCPFNLFLGKFIRNNGAIYPNMIASAVVGLQYNNKVGKQNFKMTLASFTRVLSGDLSGCWMLMRTPQNVQGPTRASG